MHPAVETLYKAMLEGMPIETDVLGLLASTEPFEPWVLHLRRVEATIGGYGTHNVNRPGTGGFIHGTWSSDRGIFRPIQYVGKALFEAFVEVNSRWIIEMSGSHLSGVLESLCDALHLQGVEDAPLGRLIHRLRALERPPFPHVIPLLKQSGLLNGVYRLGKHEFESYFDQGGGDGPLDLETHLFSFDDCMVTYFSSRVLGLAFMAEAFRLFSVPKSMDKIPDVSEDEYLSVWRTLSYNLRRWNPELTTSAARATDPYLASRRL